MTSTARHASPPGRCASKSYLRWARLLLALVPLGSGALAQAPKEPAAKTSPVKPSTQEASASGTWNPAVRLEIRGYIFTGIRYEGRRWSGTGVWLRPGVLVTNTYFITHANEVVAVDERG